MAYSNDELRLAHLFRRVGLGARPEEWLEARKLGLEATTQRLLNPQTVPDDLDELIARIGDDFIDLDNIDSVRQLWYFRLAHTKRPLQERMTLFWHNHFATAQFKVNNPRWMWNQNQLFRDTGLGSFRTLLQGVMRDAAMLVWLDGAQNTGGAPNENFGRELMELFSMGAGSGYSERDVQQAARALTGFYIDNGAGLFAPYLHDDGEKTVLGQTGNWYPDDVIDIVCAQPATAKFLCARLHRFFVGEDASPSDAKALHELYFSSGYDIGALIERIVALPAFWEDDTRWNRVQSPLELAIAQMRQLGAPLGALRDMSRDLAGMGQEVFNPPNVKGWPQGAAWINTRTLLARISFARRINGQMAQRTDLAERLKPFLQGDYSTPESAAQSLWDSFRPGLAMPSQIRNALVAKLREGIPADAKDTQAAMRFNEKLPALLDILVAAPQNQLA